MILVQLTASKQRQRGRSLRAMTASKSQGNKTCVCNRRQKTLLKDYTEYKSQTPEERQTVQNQICHATLLLFFFSTVIKFYSPVKICHYLNRVQCLQLSHNCDNENRQCADNQCP